MIARVLVVLSLVSCVNATIKACYFENAECSGSGTCEETESNTCINEGEGMGSAKSTCADGKITVSAYMSDDCSDDPLVSIDLEDGKCYDNGDGSSIQITCATAPCFARDTSVCLLTNPKIPAAQAYSDCFGDSATGSAKRIHMDQLRAGDVVLSGPDASARVVVNQHVAAFKQSAMVHITHTEGDLELTPDHVLIVDGEPKAARHVAVGSVLTGVASSPVVTSVASGKNAIVNAVTTSGYIMVAGSEGLPVVSTTYPEWIASTMLKSGLPHGGFLVGMLSYYFPEQVQSFYDAHLESLFARSHNLLGSLAAAPPAAFAVVFVLGDIAISIGFFVYLISSCVVSLLTTAAAVGAVILAKPKLKA